MKNEELAQLMKDSANDAVTIANDEFSIPLDYSKQSISLVDDILLSYLKKYQDIALDDKAVFTICNVYGAYVGETFKKLCGGQWFYDESNADAPALFLVIGDHSFAFAGICYQRLVNNGDMTVLEYFEQAISQHTSH